MDPGLGGWRGLARGGLNPLPALGGIPRSLLPPGNAGVRGLAGGGWLSDVLLVGSSQYSGAGRDRTQFIPWL